MPAVDARWSSWASFWRAPVRLIWRPSTSPSQPCSAGFGDAGVQVVADLEQPRALGGVGSQQRASQAGVFVDARGGVGAAAGAQGELAAFEVAEEFLPFLLGRHPVFLAGAQRSAAGDERAVPVDHLVGVDGLVAHGGVDVAVSGDELGDVRGHAVQDGVGDEHAPEVVRGEPQRLPGGVGESVPSSARLSHSRMVAAGMARCSIPNRRWNSSGIGGFQTRSWES